MPKTLSLVVCTATSMLRRNDCTQSWKCIWMGLDFLVERRYAALNYKLFKPLRATYLAIRLT